MIVAITGNIGSGKSVVARYLVELSGAEHCDTDIVCRNLLKKEQPGWLGVKEKWGKRFVAQDGSIDRSSLREAVFENDSIRRELENILHPHVRIYIDRLARRCRDEQRLLVVEVPLLFEVGWQKDFDYIVTVTAHHHDEVKRVVRRDGVSAEHVERILDTQMDITTKAQYSDFVIDNSGPMSKTRTQVELLNSEILSKLDPGKSKFFTGKTLDS